MSHETAIEAGKTCRVPFQHSPESCDCQPTKLERDIERFERNAAARQEQGKTHALIAWAVFVVLIPIFLAAAHAGLSREAAAYRSEARI